MRTRNPTMSKVGLVNRPEISFELRTDVFQKEEILPALFTRGGNSLFSSLLFSSLLFSSLVSRKSKQSSSWPKAKTVVKKWLNLKDSEFHSDCCIGLNESFGEQRMRRRKSCSDDRDGSLLTTRPDLSGGGWLVESSDSEENLRPPPTPTRRYGSPAPTSSWQPPKDLRMFVGTWNVGGRAPHGGLDLSDWLCIDGPASSSSPHIYVLGFQEIVPLNAGNVLGAEDKGPARKWLDLIRRALNPPSRSSSGGASATISSSSPSPSGRVSFSDLLAAEDDSSSSRTSTASSEPDDGSEPSTTPSSSSEEDSSSGRSRRHGHGYVLAASKQMVGVLLCVWVRGDVAACVSSVGVSCVGRGLMGYMGNKGSVSVSLALRGGRGTAALCFVCTHLASGDRDGDEARRNGDVAEILRRTRFPRRMPAETILEHDKVIWLGDLNYRLVAGGGARELVERKEWEALLERDQLRAEQRAGRVFAGWEEGRIRFPPTYKYVAESDAYAIDDHDDDSDSSGGGSRDKKRKKKRAPAWCDRILWRGSGVEQQWYTRGESRFSDHRPVGSLFSARLFHDDGTGEAEERRRQRQACWPPPHSSRF